MTRAIKAILFFAAAAATLFIGHIYNWSQLEVSVAFLWLLVIWIALEVSKLIDASSQPHRYDDAKIIKQIEEGKAVEPKHNPPHKPLNPLRQSEDDDQMFCDFAGFANEVNKQLDYGGWRLQEDAHGHGTRNYAILYNGLDVGRLELRPWEYPYEAADTQIAANVEIKHLRFFAYGTVFGFLETLVLLICSDTKVNFGLGKAEAENRLSAYLLETVRKPSLDYPFSLYIIGRPLNYFGKGEVREESNHFWGELGQTIKKAQRADTSAPSAPYRHGSPNRAGRQ